MTKDFIEWIIINAEFCLTHEIKEIKEAYQTAIDSN